MDLFQNLFTRVYEGVPIYQALDHLFYYRLLRLSDFSGIKDLGDELGLFPRFGDQAIDHVDIDTVLLRYHSGQIISDQHTVYNF